LGWIPFKKVAIKYADGYVQYGKHQFKLWDSYGLSKYNVKTGSFVEDSRGRWYVCLVVDSQNKSKLKPIGIDLGLKDLATCSDGVNSKPLKSIANMNKNLALLNELEIRNVSKRFTPRLKIYVKTCCINSAINW
jgi:transposase